MTPWIAPAGDRGVFVQLHPDVSFGELHAAARAVRRAAGLMACIVGHASLYLLFEDQDSFGERASRVDAALSKRDSITAATSRTHRLPVSITPEYAPDLDKLLSVAQMSRERFRELLSSLRLRARYLGFRAGFAYLEGLPDEWDMPRLPRPRMNVPAGSFGIAGKMAGFYPSDSPGGWNLIGRSPSVFWDPRRYPPNLIAPGDEVVVEVSEGRWPPAPAPVVWSEPEGDPLADVVRPGQLTLIVGAADIGRYDAGLPVGGPFDFGAAAAANRSVGNPKDATLLECALVGPQLMFAASGVLSWYGAHADVLVNEKQVREPHQFEVTVGDVVTVGRLREGMRGYLAFRGGIRNPATRFAVSPEVLRPNTRLFNAGLAGTASQVRKLRRADVHLIGALAGPHRVDASSLHAIEDQLWEVTPALDRTGIRMRPLARVIEQAADLPSCGMQFGTVQWHPNGELVALGPDHPITGGYLQPMTVLSTERWKLAQLAAGDRVRWIIQKARSQKPEARRNL